MNLMQYGLLFKGKIYFQIEQRIWEQFFSFKVTFSRIGDFPGLVHVHLNACHA